MTEVPVPQLREEFDGTVGELSFGFVDGGVVMTAVNPKFGDGAAVLTALPDGFVLQWTPSQLPVVDVTAWLLGLWVRMDVAPSSAVPLIPVVSVHSAGAGALLEATSAGEWLWMTPGGPSSTFTLPVGDWVYLELRGLYDSIAEEWTVETRIDGVDDFSGSGGAATPVEIVGVSVGHPLDGVTGLVLAVDRMWWWAGTDADPAPGWWSDLDGWDGNPPTRIIAAVVGPAEFTARTGGLNSPAEDPMHLIAGVDQGVPVTVTATVELDAQTVEVAFAPRGSNPATWDTAAWIGDPATQRTALVDVGPSETIDPTANVYDLWVRVDAGGPFRVTGEVIFT